MSLPVTLAGITVALTIPQIFFNGARHLCNKAYNTAYSAGESALDHAYNGTLAATQWTVENAPIAWERHGAPLAKKGLEVMQDLGSQASVFLSQNTKHSLLGHTITYGHAAGGLLACVAIGFAIGLIIPSGQPKPSSSK